MGETLWAPYPREPTLCALLLQYLISASIAGAVALVGRIFFFNGYRSGERSEEATGWCSRWCPANLPASPFVLVCALAPCSTGDPKARYRGGFTHFGTLALLGMVIGWSAQLLAPVVGL